MLVRCQQALLLISLVAITLLTNISRAQDVIVVQDSQGQHTFEHVPSRVAALNWDIAEQVLALGVTPIAMPDIGEYRQWVMKPEVPDSVMDIGGRVEPNLQRLASLKPDVIIIASPQLDLMPRLQQIAPVLFFQTYSEQHDNAQAAIDNFKHIATLLGRQQQAEQRLAQMDQRLAELKAQLMQAYAGQLPSVTTFRFASMTSVYQYGDNSTAQYALQRLGIAPAIKQGPTQWGVKQQRLKNLRHIGEGVALYFEPFAQEDQLAGSVMWNAMPFVRDGKMSSVTSAWNYGGAVSIEYMAEALTQSLLAIAPRKTSATEVTP
ncbi:iron-siderophore ABC transporter substrate-binding protein [Shewanella sp. Scap07]|uniref:ABC transporter substrate-binding protein n=1 Tax=Shewanella sp. Scap07 TaxID=2589987 RepID=UPI0015BC2B77|nr:iron-siderophore ABC transporter substrate-binding protein [Shewanella sp. Scap07]QLE83947.1 iron-siderophore ABC transporter substrate-binding protein [Shewanella sp. Scap07]